MSLHYTHALLFLAFYSGVSKAQDQALGTVQTPASFTIAPLESRESGMTALPISGSYQAEKRQAPTVEGLKLQISLTNQSDQSIQLFWFPDLVRIYMGVKNDRTTFICLREPGGRAQMRGNVATNVPDTRKLEVPYQILSLKINDRELTSKEIYEDRITDLPPHCHVSLKIAINKVIISTPLPENTPRIQTATSITSEVRMVEKEGPLPTGIYRLLPSVTLFEDYPSPGRRSINLHTSREEREQVIVNYTRPKEKK